jgi:PAS domain S-box-containing protein
MSLSEKIINAQKELLAIFDGITDPICVIDETLTIKRLNMAMAEVIGLDLKSVIGDKCYAHLMGRDAPCESCYFGRADGGLYNPGCGFVKRRQRGKDVVFELTVYPTPNAVKKGAIFHYKNISDRMRLERHLGTLRKLLDKNVDERHLEIERTRKKFDKIINHSPVGISILNESKAIVTANPAFEAVFDATRGGLIGKDITKLLNEENRERFGLFFGELMMSGARSIQVTNRKKSGQDIEVVIIGFLLEAAKTEPRDIALMIQDITEKKEVERALLESERTAQVLLNATTDVALLIDTSGNIISINDAAAKLIEKNAEELIGRSIFDLYPEDVIKGRKAWGEEVIRTKKPVRFEDERDGIYFDNSVYPVFNVKGKVERLAVFAQNITRRKILTRELISREAHAASGRMSSTVAQEIRKRILSVKHHLGIFENEIDPHGSKKHHLKKSSEELEKIRELLEQVRKFYVAGKGEREFVDVNAVIGDLLPIVESRLRDHNITVSTSLNKKLPEVFVYPAMVKQALVHLINNADDAMRRGGTIRITTQKRANAVQLIVADQGPGMEKKALEKVRDPGYMGERGKVALGLFICKDIMKRNGGSLEITSVKGEGTRVTLTFPLYSEVSVQEKA